MYLVGLGFSASVVKVRRRVVEMGLGLKMLLVFHSITDTLNYFELHY